MSVSKQPFSYAEMAAHLSNTFSLISGENEAKKYFASSIPFGRFISYLKALQMLPDGTNFISTSTLGEIVESFDFDRELRILLMDYILRIEEGIRTTAFETGYWFFMNDRSGSTDDGPWWYLQPCVYRPRVDIHSNCFDKIREKVDPLGDWRSDPKRAPKSWDMAVCSGLTFGALNIMLANFDQELIRKIGWNYGALYPDGNTVPGNVISGWAPKIGDLRNRCGHSDFVWVYSPEKGEIHFPPSMRQDVIDNSSLYAYVAAIRILLPGVCPGRSVSTIPTNFVRQLSSIFKKADTTWGAKIDFRSAMGFPEDWETSRIMI